MQMQILPRHSGIDFWRLIESFKKSHQVGAGRFSWFSHAQQRRIDNRRVFTSPSRAERAASKARRASVTPVRGAK